jgi:hypothetical protein
MSAASEQTNNTEPRRFYAIDTPSIFLGGPLVTSAPDANAEDKDPLGREYVCVHEVGKGTCEMETLRYYGTTNVEDQPGKVSPIGTACKNVVARISYIHHNHWSDKTTLRRMGMCYNNGTHPSLREQWNHCFNVQTVFVRSVSTAEHRLHLAKQIAKVLDPCVSNPDLAWLCIGEYTFGLVESESFDVQLIAMTRFGFMRVSEETQSLSSTVQCTPDSTDESGLCPMDIDVSEVENDAISNIKLDESDSYPMDTPAPPSSPRRVCFRSEVDVVRIERSDARERRIERKARKTQGALAVVDAPDALDSIDAYLASTKHSTSVTETLAYERGLARQLHTKGDATDYTTNGMRARATIDNAKTYDEKKAERDVQVELTETLILAPLAEAAAKRHANMCKLIDESVAGINLERALATLKSQCEIPKQDALQAYAASAALAAIATPHVASKPRKVCRVLPLFHAVQHRCDMCFARQRVPGLCTECATWSGAFQRPGEPQLLCLVCDPHITGKRERCRACSLQIYN